MPHRIPIIEWAVGAFGALLLVAILVFLIREATRGAGKPADIVTSVGAVIKGEGGWLVRVTAQNTGDEAAADVTFQGILRRGASEGTEGNDQSDAGNTILREAHVDYLPGHSRREFALVFPVDPRQGVVTIETIGHQTP